MMLKLYDVGSDEQREATQADIDNLQIGCNKLSQKIVMIEALSKLNVVKDKEILIQLSKILKV